MERSDWSVLCAYVINTNIPRGGLIIGERDSIRGVQIRAGAVYMYMYGGTCVILVAHATHT